MNDDDNVCNNNLSQQRYSIHKHQILVIKKMKLKCMRAGESLFWLKEKYFFVNNSS